jgi:hypothetical protein
MYIAASQEREHPAGQLRKKKKKKKGTPCQSGFKFTLAN